MSWQKCPVCNGIKSFGFQKCNTCNGTGIINELTGHPPKSDVKISSNISTDFRDNNIETQQEYFGK